MNEGPRGNMGSRPRRDGDRPPRDGPRSFNRGGSGGRDGPRRNFSGNRPGFNRNPSFGGPREMHKATCTKCGKACEVPFKPTEGKPVFCRDCYTKKF